MPIAIQLPALSPTMSEGRITKWLKKEGDKVSSGDALAECETDKSNLEIEATDSGTLLKIVVPGGSSAPIGGVIGWLGKPGEAIPDAPASAPAAAPAVAPAPAPAAAAPKAAPAPVSAVPAKPLAAPVVAAPAERLRVRDVLVDQLFTSGLARSLWRGLRAALDSALEAGTAVDALERLPVTIEGEERRLAQALSVRLGATVELTRIRIGIDQTILRLEADRLEEAMAWSRSEIAEAEREGDAARVRTLMEAERDLGQKRKALDRRFLASGVLTAAKGGSK
jgi:pyruvate dehydrogenase E2 component (dihydrolipoamide acetyltransferase)